MKNEFQLNYLMTALIKPFKYVTIQWLTMHVFLDYLKITLLPCMILIEMLIQRNMPLKDMLALIEILPLLWQLLKMAKLTALIASFASHHHDLMIRL